MAFWFANDQKTNVSQDNMTFAEFKIVAQKSTVRLWHVLPKRALIAVSVLFALPVFGVLTAFGVATDTQLDKIERHDLVESLSLPAFKPDALKNEQFRASERVQRGDTVATLDRKSTRLNSSHPRLSRMPSSA